MRLLRPTFTSGGGRIPSSLPLALALGPSYIDASAAGPQQDRLAAAIDRPFQMTVFHFTDDVHGQFTVNTATGGRGIEIKSGPLRNTQCHTSAGGFQLYLVR